MSLLRDTLIHERTKWLSDSKNTLSINLGGRV